MADTEYDYVIKTTCAYDVCEPERLKVVDIPNSSPPITSANLLGTRCDCDPQDPGDTGKIYIRYDDPLTSADETQLGVVVAAHDGRTKTKDINQEDAALATSDKVLLQGTDPLDESVALDRDSSTAQMLLQDKHIQTAKPLAVVAALPIDEKDVNTPPGTPSTGYRVIVGSSPTGDFVGHAGEIAHYNGSAWVFTTPEQGTVLYVRTDDEPYKQTAASTPWKWDRVYAGKDRNKNDSEGSTNSSSWTVHVRLPASGTLDLQLGDYEILGTVLAYGTNAATQIGLRLREDETTTICEVIVLPAVTGDTKQPCIARDWLEGKSGSHYYTIEFNKPTGAGVAKVSHSRLSLHRLDTGT